MIEWSHYYPYIVDYKYPTRDKSREEKRIIFEIKNWFYIDREVMKTEILRRIVDTSVKSRFSYDNLKNATIKIISMVLHKPVLFVFLIVVLFTPFFLFKSDQKLFAVMLLSGWGLLTFVFLIALLTKIEYRVLIPIITVIIFLFFLFYRSIFKKIIISMPIKSIFFLLGLTGIIVFQSMIYIKNINKQRDNCRMELTTLENFLSNYKNNTVFLVASPGSNFNPLHFVKWNNNQVLIPMIGWCSNNEESYRTIKAITGSDSLPQICRWISNHNSDVYIYSDSKENKLLETIFQYHDIIGSLKPVKIMNQTRNAGFYRFVENE
jgi:hypothetical protein